MKNLDEIVLNQQKDEIDHESWSQGVYDAFNHENIKDPDNRNYQIGWYEGKGMNDGCEGIVTVDFKPINNTELFNKYFESFISAQFGKMCH